MNLTESQIERIFPFHLQVTAGGQIVSVGRSLKKILPHIEGRRILEVFFMREPVTTDRSWSPKEIGNSPVILEENGGDLILQGEVLWISRKKQSLFIGTPAIREKDDISSLGLEVSDFPAYLGVAERVQDTDSVGHLASGIAHDFNNYLLSIVGNICLAQEDPSMTVESLRLAIAACEDARQLTRQLLTFSNGGEPVKEVGDISVAIEQAASIALAGSRVSVQLNSPEDLWAASFDSGQISQVIRNLCQNAAEALEGAGTVQLSLENVPIGKQKHTALAAGPYIQVEISDSGPGLTPEMVEKIWEPHFSTKRGNSGLGLSTCRSIVMRHDGAMDVHSREGEGTTFRFWVPAITIAKERVREAPIFPSELPNYRILVMDDQEPVRLVARRMFERMGQKVETVANGNEAIEAFQSALETDEPYDLAVLDMTIPGGMGGMETISKLREIYPDVYAVVCSGYTKENSLEYYRDCGFDTVLAKPFTTAEVRTLLTSRADEVALIS